MLRQRILNLLPTALLTTDAVSESSVDSFDRDWIAADLTALDVNPSDRGSAYRAKFYEIHSRF